MRWFLRGMAARIYELRHMGADAWPCWNFLQPKHRAHLISTFLHLKASDQHLTKKRI